MIKFKKIIFYGCVISIGLIASVTLVSFFYIQSFGKNIYTSVDQVPRAPVALILGGGMKKDGVTMSEMQTDRVIQGIELYKAGKVQKLIMTGDDGANNANEVGAMHDFAVESGVPDENVEVDPHGYNTYKSCYRAKHVFGLNQIIAVSQNFHLSRILYFCSRQGIEVIGFSADIREYGLWAHIWPQGLREMLARVKAVVSSQSDAVGNTVVY